jgi:hypothetical protein
MILLNSLAKQVNITKYRLVVPRRLANIFFSAGGSWKMARIGPQLFDTLVQRYCADTITI